MSYPILYSATETNFDHNGIGTLSACVSCEVTEEANGIFELAMQYPMDGIHYENIADRAIIKSRADQFREPQLFRVYAISKPMNGIVTVLAEHISYDLSGIPVRPFSADGVILALEGLKNNSVIDCPFTFWTDKSANGNFSVIVPSSIRSRLGGVSGSILDVYGGEYEFDNYTVKLHNSRGMNRGVSIRYGKNLTDIQQDQNCSSVATGVYPYWVDSDGANLVELPEKIVPAPGTYNFVKIRTLDLSQSFETQPTVEQLRSKAENFVEANKIGIPDVSLTVSFAQLEQSDEYKNLKLLERVSLFDTVNVEFPALGVSATAKAVKIVYDSLANRVKSVTIGNVRANIADTIANQDGKLEETKKELKTDLQKAKEAATEWLTNGKGYKVERRDAYGNSIDTLYMDTPDIETAVNILRIGQSGIGFSHNGVNGPYESAWTIDGQFVADFITAGTLNAALVRVINLIAEKVVSIRDNSTLEIDGANLDMKLPVGRTFSLSNWDLSAEGIGGGDARAIFTERNGQGEAVHHAYISPWFIGLSGADLNDPILLIQTVENRVELGLPNCDMRTLFWQDNGDGTHNLIGSESEELKEIKYTKRLDLGNPGATTSQWQTISFPHNISGINKVIKCDGYITGSKATTLPAINGGVVMVWADKTNVYLYRESVYTPPSDERLYVQIWYTK